MFTGSLLLVLLIVLFVRLSQKQAEQARQSLVWFKSQLHPPQGEGAPVQKGSEAA